MFYLVKKVHLQYYYWSKTDSFFFQMTVYLKCLNKTATTLLFKLFFSLSK